jgi:hypothetical protein
MKRERRESVAVGAGNKLYEPPFRVSRLAVSEIRQSGGNG